MQITSYGMSFRTVKCAVKHLCECLCDGDVEPRSADPGTGTPPSKSDGGKKALHGSL